MIDFCRGLWDINENGWTVGIYDNGWSSDINISQRKKKEEKEESSTKKMTH